MTWRKILGWPVLVIGICGLVYFVITLFGEEKIEWQALLPIAGFITVGASWVRGEVAGSEEKTEGHAGKSNQAEGN